MSINKKASIELCRVLREGKDDDDVSGLMAIDIKETPSKGEYYGLRLTHLSGNLFEFTTSIRNMKKLLADDPGWLIWARVPTELQLC